MDEADFILRLYGCLAESRQYFVINLVGNYWEYEFGEKLLNYPSDGKATVVLDILETVPLLQMLEFLYDFLFLLNGA